MAAIDYYEGSPSEFGNYQYVKLEEIINNYIMSRDTDDYTSAVPRFQIIYQAKRGMRELYYDVVREIRMIEMELSPNLTVTLPPDFVNYVRISWVDSNGKLHPMAVDNSMNIALAYLQDNEYNFLYDDFGCVLQGSGVRENPNDPLFNNGEFGGYKCYTFDTPFTPNANLSNVYTNGKFRVDKDRGVIEFGATALGRNIVLEYISDGLFTGCEGKPEADIRIHKFAEQALLDFIYYSLIKQRRNVPANEKKRGRDEFYNSRRVAKRRINTLRQDEMLQIFKGESKWIKGE